MLLCKPYTLTFEWAQVTNHCSHCWRRYISLAVNWCLVKTNWPHSVLGLNCNVCFRAQPAENFSWLALRGNLDCEYLEAVVKQLTGLHVDIFQPRWGNKSIVISLFRPLSFFFSRGRMNDGVKYISSSVNPSIYSRMPFFEIIVKDVQFSIHTQSKHLLSLSTLA